MKIKKQSPDRLTDRRALRAKERAERYQLSLEQSEQIERRLGLWKGVHWVNRKKNPWRVQVYSNFGPDGKMLPKKIKGWRTKADFVAKEYKLIFDGTFHSDLIAAHVYNLFAKKYGWMERDPQSGLEAYPNDLSLVRTELIDVTDAVAKQCQQVLLDDGSKSALVTHSQKGKETQLYQWFTNYKGKPVRYFLEGEANVVEQELTVFLTGKICQNENCDYLDCRMENINEFYP